MAHPVLKALRWLVPLAGALAFAVPVLAQSGAFENRTTFGSPSGPTPIAGGINAQAVSVNGTPVVSSGIDGCVFTTATPATGTFLGATSNTACEWTTPTPRATDTPIPPVATATPRATDTPIPAPTLFPTLAAGELVVGTGGQGVQDGKVAVTTATPPAATYLYDALGGAGSVLNYATAVPTATVVSTATPANTPTPRATDTPIPTATPQTMMLVFSNAASAGPSAGNTAYLGLGSDGPLSGEANAKSPLTNAVTLAKMYVSVGTAPAGSDTFIYTLRKNGADTTITCTITGAATTCNDTAHTVALVAGDLVDVKVVASATAASSIHNVTVSN